MKSFEAALHLAHGVQHFDPSFFARDELSAASVVRARKLEA